MAKIPYLTRRNNVFYFRLGVPADLREIVKSREIIQSLQTQNSEEAARKALALAAHFKALLHELKSGKHVDGVTATGSEIAPIQAPQGVIQAQAVQIPAPFKKRHDRRSCPSSSKTSSTRHKYGQKLFTSMVSIHAPTRGATFLCGHRRTFR